MNSSQMDQRRQDRSQGSRRTTEDLRRPRASTTHPTVTPLDHPADLLLRSPSRRPGMRLPAGISPRGAAKPRRRHRRWLLTLRAPLDAVHALPAAWRELLLLVSLYTGYTASRQLASDNRGLAMHHAMDILGLQRALHINVELTGNLALSAVPALAVVTAYWYALLHYIVTPIVLFAVYRRRPEHYPWLRNALVLATIAALACYLVFPVAPPRFVDGYVDTLRQTAQWGWWGGQASVPRGLGQMSNQLAAMPSMHVGWAVWCAVALRRLVPGPRGRWVYVYPTLTTVVVVVTANHWLLDAVFGAAFVAAAVALARPRDDRQGDMLTA